MLITNAYLILLADAKLMKCIICINAQLRVMICM